MGYLTCKCVPKQVEWVRRRQKAESAYGEHFGFLYMKVRYRPYNKDGQPSKRWSYTHVDHVFCPFCGKKLKPPPIPRRRAKAKKKTKTR